ncbi:MAG: hypothetical protein E7212_04100 [Clostridium sartagoforme]|nr:hypothetical protein [Clostridium sartagoforme]
MYHNNMNREHEDDLKFIPLNLNEVFEQRDSSWFPIIDMALPQFTEIPNSFALNFAFPIDNSSIEGSSLKTLDYVQNDNNNLQNNNTNQGQNGAGGNFDLEFPSEIMTEDLVSYNKDSKCKKGTGISTPGSNTSPNSGGFNTGTGTGNMNNVPGGNTGQSSGGFNTGTGAGNMNNVPGGNTGINSGGFNTGTGTGNMNNVPGGNTGQSSGGFNTGTGAGNMNNVPGTNTGLNSGGFNTGIGTGNMNNVPGSNTGLNSGGFNTGIGTGNMNNVPGSNTGLNSGGFNTGSSTNMPQINSGRTLVEVPIHMELLRNLSFQNILDNNYRGGEESTLNEVDTIFNIIKGDNSIVDTFKAYNIPAPIYNLVIKKIIYVTLENLRGKGGE